MKNMHPSVISRAYLWALDTALETCERLALAVDVSDPERMRTLIRSCIGTKFVSRCVAVFLVVLLLLLLFCCTTTTLCFNYVLPA